MSERYYPHVMQSTRSLNPLKVQEALIRAFQKLYEIAPPDDSDAESILLNNTVFVEALTRAMNTGAIFLRDQNFIASSSGAAWNGHLLDYNGVRYIIDAGGYTTDKYIYWDINEAQLYQTSNTFPTLGDGIFLIAVYDSSDNSVHEFWNSKMAPGYIVADLIAAGTITADEIAAGSIETDHLAANAVTAAKIAANTITAAEIASNAITADEISANAVTTAKLDALAVTAAKIAASAIETDKLAANAVTAAKIAANTITAAEIASNAITADEISANAVTTAKLDALAVTADKIAASAVETDKLAANAVTAAKITAGTITSTEIAAGTITGSNIAATTITASNIVSGTITGTQIAATTITASNIVSATITGTQIAATTITASNIVSGTITGTQIAATTITGDNIAATTITAAKIDITDLFAQTITATGTITGATIRTAAANERIQIDSTEGLRAYDDTGTLQTQIHLNHSSGNGLMETSRITGKSGSLRLDHDFVANPTSLILTNNQIEILIGAAGEGDLRFTTNSIDIDEMDIVLDAASDITVGGNAIVNGDTTLNTALVSSTLEVGGSLTVTGDITVQGSSDINMGTGGIEFSSDTGLFGTSSSLDLYADGEEIFAVTNPGTSTTLSGCYIMYNNALKQIRFKDDGSGDRVLYVQP